MATNYQDIDNVIDSLVEPARTLSLDLKIIKSNKEIIDQAEDSLSETLNILFNPQANLLPIQEKVLFLIPKSLNEASSYKLESIKGDFMSYINGYEDSAKQLNKIILETNKEILKLSEEGKEIENIFDSIKDNFENKINQYNKVISILKEGFKDIDPANIPNEELRKEFPIEKIKQEQKMKNFINKINSLESKYNLIYKNISDKIIRQEKNIKQLPKSINCLAKEICKAIFDFEKIGKEIANFKDETEFNQCLNTIKGGLEKIKNILLEEQNNLNYELNSMKIKREENLDEIIKKCESEYAELNEISKDICYSINSLRDKYNREKIEEKLFFMTIDDIESISEDVYLMQKKIESKYLNIIEKYEIIKDIPTKIKNNQFTLDLLIIMDITSSMDLYFTNIKNKLSDIVIQIIENCNQNKLRLGFVGYKDFDDMNYVNIELTEDFSSIRNTLEDVQVNGGIEGAKDVAGALSMCINKKWEANARYAVLITDSPPHGEKFHNPDVSDSYSSKDFGLMDSVQKMIKNKINLITLEISENTEVFFNLLKKKYENTGLKYEVKRSGNTPDDLVSIIAESAVQTYLGYRLDTNKGK